MESFLFRQFHFLLERQHGAEIWVNLLTKKARWHERLVNFPIKELWIQDKSMTRENGNETKTEQIVSRMEISEH